MIAVRALVGLAGLAVGAWGVWLLRDDGIESWSSQAWWLAGGVLVNDGLLVPLVIGLGALAGRVLPASARLPVVVGFVVWATVTVAVVNVVSGVGGRADNPSLLPRDYLVSWLAFTLVVAGVAAAWVVRRIAAARTAAS